jgi:hypothetical protein
MPLEVNFNYDRNIRRAQPRTLFRVSDGDTPVIDQPVRMVSCDTPEKAHYAGRPEVSQPKLDSCRQKLGDGFYDEIPSSPRSYLRNRLTATAAAKHINAGNDATVRFEAILEERLAKPDGKKTEGSRYPNWRNYRHSWKVACIPGTLPQAIRYHLKMILKEGHSIYK